MPDFVSNVKKKIYTTGYTAKNVADLPVLLAKFTAVLADIRFAPHSQHLQWRRDYLKVLLKQNYRHVAAFGNRTYKENKITIHNFDLGLKVIESWNENVVLMCACENLENCHRFAVMNELKKRGYDVEEVINWNPPEIAPKLF
ncbi:MAG TPA: hypothetical protein PKY59_19010 [Pyrinomonadaceae bacterium]|nr:hypothetical protein [Pyrinomonadaceae bacterium]